MYTYRMIDPSPTQVVSLISIWGYIVILPVSIIEGPIIAVISGFLVSMGQLNFYIVLGILLLGDALGDIMYYSIGRWIHGPIARIFSARVDSRRQTQLQKMFNKHSIKILLINKMHTLGSVTLYYAGVLRMPLARFMIINVLGSVPKVLIFLAVGYFFGASYLQLQKYIGYLAIVSLAIPATFLVIYWRSSHAIAKRNDTYRD